MRTVLLFFATLSAAIAAPMDFRELSFLVRVGEPEQAIVQQIATRKLARTLNENEIATLKGQRAPDGVLRMAVDPRFAMSEAELKASEAAKERQKPAEPSQPAVPVQVTPTERGIAEVSREKPRFVNVKYGEPFDLSRWSGLGLGQVRFFPKGLGVLMARGKPTFIDPFAKAGGDYRSDPYTWEETLQKYSPAQLTELEISRRVVVDGLMFSPVLEGSGATLYLVTHSIDGVQLAISTARP